MKLQNSEFKLIPSKNIDDYWITAYDLSEKSYKMTNFLVCLEKLRLNFHRFD